MCCKCYKLSALAAVDGNSTFRNFTLKVARRKGVNCNRQFSMVIVPSAVSSPTVFNGDNDAISSPSSKKFHRSGVCCYLVS